MISLGICDTGFSSSLIKTMNVLSYKDFNSRTIDHGTNVLKVVKSVFNDCNLVLAGTNLDSTRDVCSALMWLLDFDLYALNLSWVCVSRNEKIMNLLKLIEKKGTRIFCAKNERYLYPWSEFIGIGKDDFIDKLDGIEAQGSSISCIAYSASFMKNSFGKTENKNNINHYSNLEQLNLDI